jgi:hypothetical protein
MIVPLSTSLRSSSIRGGASLYFNEPAHKGGMADFQFHFLLFSSPVLCLPGALPRP